MIDEMETLMSKEEIEALRNVIGKDAWTQEDLDYVRDLLMKRDVFTPVYYKRGLRERDIKGLEGIKGTDMEIQSTINAGNIGDMLINEEDHLLIFTSNESFNEFLKNVGEDYYEEEVALLSLAYDFLMDYAYVYKMKFLFDPYMPSNGHCMEHDVANHQFKLIKAEWMEE